MGIWFEKFTLADVNRRGIRTLVEHLGIVITEIGEGHIRGTMPVDHRTKQPAGLLHGGASVAFAETLTSTAANLTIDQSRWICVGLEINANHVRSVTEGQVDGIATPMHVGRTTQVWETKITQGDKLVCVSRITLAVLERHGKHERRAR